MDRGRESKRKSQGAESLAFLAVAYKPVGALCFESNLPKAILGSQREPCAFKLAGLGSISYLVFKPSRQNFLSRRPS